MPRHDYDLPADWESKTDEEKDKWFKQERSRRQVLRQKTAHSRRIKKAMKRIQRRVEARNKYTIGGKE